MAVDASRYFDEGREQFGAWTPLLWDPLGEALVEVAAPAPGERVLDACCGAGSSALPAARAVGSAGWVDGIDLADGLLDSARARAAKAGLGNVGFTRADVTSWRAEPYDVVLCGCGVFFLPDMDADTDRLLGLLRPGGRFAMTCWPRESLDAVFRPFFAAVGRHRPDILAAPKPRFSLNSERLSDEGSLREWLVSRGLGDLTVRRGEHRVPITADQGWDLLHSGPLRAVLSGVDDDTRERVHRSFLDEFAAAGTDVLAAPFLAAVGRRG